MRFTFLCTVLSTELKRWIYPYYLGSYTILLKFLLAWNIGGTFFRSWIWLTSN